MCRRGRCSSDCWPWRHRSARPCTRWGDSQFATKSLVASLPFHHRSGIRGASRRTAAQGRCRFLALTLVCFGIGAASWQAIGTSSDLRTRRSATISRRTPARAIRCSNRCSARHPRRALRVQLPTTMPWFTLRAPDKEADAVGPPSRREDGSSTFDLTAARSATSCRASRAALPGRGPTTLGRRLSDDRDRLRAVDMTRSRRNQYAGERIPSGFHRGASPLSKESRALRIGPSSE